MSRLGRLAALLGLAIGIVGLGIDFVIIMNANGTAAALDPVVRSPPSAFVYFWTFFTHLTNLGLVLTYLAMLRQWRWLGWFRRPVTRAALAGMITLVMLFFHFLLAPHFTFTGWLLVANYLLHYAAPLFYLGWWAAFAGHGTLRFRHIPLMLLPGLAYIAWVLVRGAVTGEYPYDILDAAKNGYLGVAAGAGIIVVAVALFCALVVLLDRLLARRA